MRRGRQWERLGQWSRRPKQSDGTLQLLQRLRVRFLTRKGAKMVEPRLAPEGALTTASTFWRFVDGRSGSEWGIVPCVSRSLRRNGSWRCLALAVLAVVILPLSMAAV